MRAQWLREKEIIAEIRKAQPEIEHLRALAEEAQREGNLGKAAELSYGRIPEIEKKLDEMRKRFAQVQEKGGYLKEEVTENDIAAIVAKWTGIPVAKIVQGEMDKLLHLEDELKKRVVGQEEAIVAVANAVRRSRAGLGDDKRPIGSFLFLGPTGVGKTELAKALAEYLFDDERAMIRLDMSEYMEKHSVARLIGAPPGYIGYDEGGQLTEPVRRRPYSVILFDEVEKAHPDVWNILLAVLDDGRLTDGQGRTVDFKNTVLILTSNVASAQMQAVEEKEDLDEATRKELVRRSANEELRKLFRPEFLNRLDEIVIFTRLAKAELRRVVDVQLKRFLERLSRRNLWAHVTDRARDFLGEAGFDPQYGARPLKRAIQRYLEDPLAKKVLSGEFAPGAHVQVDHAGGDELTFGARVQN